MVGEVDPDYMYFEKAISRMANHLNLEKMKFIFILRNPVDRAFSHYLMTYRRGLEKLSFEEAIAVEKERITASYHAKLHFSYVDRGFYHTQITRFLNFSHISKLHFILFEDFVTHPVTTLESLYSFLGVTTETVRSSEKYKVHSARIPRSTFFLGRIKKAGIEKKIIRVLIPWKDLRHRLRELLIRL